jgi:hypothetical protein
VDQLLVAHVIRAALSERPDVIHVRSTERYELSADAASAVVPLPESLLHRVPCAFVTLARGVGAGLCAHGVVLTFPSAVAVELMVDHAPAESSIRHTQ